ncbi:SDR family NAD(P)-dependent oxidoreductase [Amphritea sp. HPY]|uniref:SDR family NAD(P)-dependent oxidoreductase n=1 Tax=Amphritea sp. HPY TaxID=3421652 RepID=UPI003D7DA313
MTYSDENKSNSWALVTGSSGGIGLAFAEELAKKKKSIILVARNENRLVELSKKISQQYGVATKTVAADLSSLEGVNHLISETKELKVNLLINNAGKEESGSFLTLPPAEMLSSIALNCSAPLLLTHHLANKMASQGGGQILFISSIVAFQGVPLIANYAATKSYLLTFAEGIALELESQGVKISIAAPGFTKTNLAPHQNFESTPFKPLDAEFVAHYTLNKLGKRRLIIPGFINKVLFYLGKYLQSRRKNSQAFGKVFRLVLRDELAITDTAKVEQ